MFTKKIVVVCALLLFFVVLFAVLSFRTIASSSWKKKKSSDDDLVLLLSPPSPPPQEKEEEDVAATPQQPLSTVSSSSTSSEIVQSRNTLRDIAFGSEFVFSSSETSSSPPPPKLHRWPLDKVVVVAISEEKEEGDVGDDDDDDDARREARADVQHAIAEINRALAPDGRLHLRLIADGKTAVVTSSSTDNGRSGVDIVVHFVAPPTEFGGETNDGIFVVETHPETHEIVAADIYVRPGISAAARRHLVLEELTQSLGLMRDTWKDPACIFYQGWTTIDTLPPQSRALVHALYARADLWTGMTLSDYDALTTSEESRHHWQQRNPAVLTWGAQGNVE